MVVLDVVFYLIYLCYLQISDPAESGSFFSLYFNNKLLNLDPSLLV